MPPAIAPCVEMGQPAAAIGRERRRHLLDATVGGRCATHHLASKLHAGGLQVEAANRGSPERAEPAVEVADRNAKNSRPMKLSTGLPK